MKHIKESCKVTIRIICCNIDCCFCKPLIDTDSYKHIWWTKKHYIITGHPTPNSNPHTVFRVSPMIWWFPGLFQMIVILSNVLQSWSASSSLIVSPLAKEIVSPLPTDANLQLSEKNQMKLMQSSYLKVMYVFSLRLDVYK